MVRFHGKRGYGSMIRERIALKSILMRKVRRIHWDPILSVR